MPLILPGNVGSATASTTFSVANSVRMNDGDTPYFNKTPSAGDRAKWTFSCWFKLGSAYSSTHGILVAGGGSADQSTIRLDSGVIDWVEWDQSGSATQGRLITNRVFRDPTGWMHLVCTWDSDNASSGDRMKMYINGVRETSFSTGTYPTSGYDSAMNSNVLHEIGRQSWNSSQYFDGYFAEMAFCDGQAYAASDFGEFDEDSPTIWKPKNISTLTFGTRGWYLDFEDSGDLDDDESGNGNDWTANNLAAADQYVDSPTKNYATWNPLVENNSVTFSEGNTFGTKSSAHASIVSTIAVNNGKFYMEFKVEVVNPRTIGLARSDFIDWDDYLGSDEMSWGTYWEATGNAHHSHAGSDIGTTSSMATSTGDILQLAFDGATGKCWIGKNNTWLDSGDPAAGSNPIFTLSATDLTYDIFFAVNVYDGALSANFGNGQFKGTAISSAGTTTTGDDSIWEYDCPSGFYGLSAKNLNQ